jgi:two-component system, LytTR family, sensor kinase
MVPCVRWHPRATGLHYLYQRPSIRLGKGFSKWVLVAFAFLSALFASSAAWLFKDEILGLKVGVQDSIYHDSFYRFLALIFWHLIYFGVEMWLEAQHLREVALQSKLELRVGEMQRLSAQLNPHFFFNALNTIKAGADNPKLTQEHVQNLADYMRFSLQESRQMEPFSRELDAIGDYIAIQQARFGDDLVCQMHIVPAALNVLVPPVLLQPLLENAFKYGGETGELPLQIEVTVSLTVDYLTIRVANSGCWIEQSSSVSTGIGLANLRKRLNLLYLGEALLDTAEEEGRVIVCVKMPVVREGGKGHEAGV